MIAGAGAGARVSEATADPALTHDQKIAKLRRFTKGVDSVKAKHDNQIHRRRPWAIYAVLAASGAAFGAVMTVMVLRAGFIPPARVRVVTHTVIIRRKSRPCGPFLTINLRRKMVRRLGVSDVRVLATLRQFAFSHPRFSLPQIAHLQIPVPHAKPVPLNRLARLSVTFNNGAWARARRTVKGAAQRKDMGGVVVR